MSDKSIPILKLENLSRIYAPGTAREITAVRDLSLSLAPGESLGIVGESGCGKSTLARLVTLQDSLTGGKIFFDGREITGLKGKSRTEVYREMQMVFQNPFGAFSPRMPVGDYLTESLRYLKKRPKKEALEIAKALMKQVDLSPELIQRFPHELSGGQLQRIVIARALSVQPRLLILDEPTSALDVSVQAAFLRMLADRLDQERISCILIGHDPAVVRSVTHRIAVMYAGSIMEILDSETLMHNHRHPYTDDLLNSIFTIRHVKPEVRSHALKTITESAARMTAPAAVTAVSCPYAGRCAYAKERCFSEKPVLRYLDGREACACFRV